MTCCTQATIWNIGDLKAFPTCTNHMNPARSPRILKRKPFVLRELCLVGLQLSNISNSGQLSGCNVFDSDLLDMGSWETIQKCAKRVILWQCHNINLGNMQFCKHSYYFALFGFWFLYLWSQTWTFYEVALEFVSILKDPTLRTMTKNTWSNFGQNLVIWICEQGRDLCCIWPPEIWKCRKCKLTLGGVD